jgi:predicted permease
MRDVKRMMADLDRDIREHIEMETQDNIGRGMSPGDARYAAMRKFGNVRRVKEDTREVWIFVWLEQLLQDVRFALRTLRKNPGFALTAAVILALGIAANVIVFGVVQGLVLRPLDVPHADRVMTLQPKHGGPFLSHPEMRDVRDSNTVFSAVAATEVQDFGLEANGVTRPVWGSEVSGQYFEVVGIRPFLGRLLQRSDDDHPGASQAAVLSWAAWKSDFGADPNIVGTMVRIDKHAYTIVGVTPEDFYGTEKIGLTDIFVPMANEASLDGTDWLESRSYKNIFSIVRIKDGITLPQVQAELNTIAGRISRQNPKDEEGLALKLARPGLVGDFIGGPVRGFLVGVMVLAGIVLLAACANLGSLFAARTADRTREIAIRMAIGSSRWRIFRQVLAEAFVISIFGGACACGLAWMALTGMAEWHPPTPFPIKFLVMPQPSLILIGFIISVLAGVLFGVIPLRQIFKTDPNDAIKSGGSQASSGDAAGHSAMCCWRPRSPSAASRSPLPLSRCAAWAKALTMDLGFKPQNAVRTQFDLSQAGYTSGAAADRFQRQLCSKRPSQMPGVDAAGYANATPARPRRVPMAGVYSQQTVRISDPTNKAFDTYFYKRLPGIPGRLGNTIAGRDAM